MTPPIRFLALIVGGWAVARTFALEPDLGTARDRAGDRAAHVDRRAGRARSPISVPALDDPTRSKAGGGVTAASKIRLANALPLRAPWVTNTERSAPVSSAGYEVSAISSGAMSFRVDATPLSSSSQAQRLAAVSMPPDDVRLKPAILSPISLPAPTPATFSKSRLSADAWMLARGGDGAGALAAGSALLGGSQAGARSLYRLAGDASAPVSLSARLSSPLRRNGAEAAVGIEWQPGARIPLRLLAERRERLSGTGRSALALLAHGGVSDFRLPAGFRLDAYAQGGIVGARKRDLFADGGVTLVRPLKSGGIEVGAGVWGGAQPGVARLDIGPRATTTLAAGARPVRVSVDWRFRVAGDAAPTSGPALTLATGF